MRTLASGVIPKGTSFLYRCPQGRWGTVYNIQIVNKAGVDVSLDLLLKSASQESHLSPFGFILKTPYKCEFDQTLGLNPGGYLKVVVNNDGLTYIVTGDERTSE